MELVLKVLKEIGSPFAPAEACPGREKELYSCALANSVGLFYLDTLKKKGRLRGELLAEYQKGYSGYLDALAAGTRISQELQSLEVRHALLNLVKPFPHAPGSVDVVLLCPSGEFRRAVARFLARGYTKISNAPSYILACTPDALPERSPFDFGATRHNIKFYKNLAASHIVYIDKNRLLDHLIEVKMGEGKAFAFSPVMDLAIIVANSLFADSVYTLRDYYTMLHVFSGMGVKETSAFLQIAKENRITRALAMNLLLTGTLHEAAHGFVPESVKQQMGILGTPDPHKKLKMPKRFGLRERNRAFTEKFPEKTFRKSLVRQLAAMLNVKFGYETIRALLRR